MGVLTKREVPAEGPHDAKIALIGEAPGASEERLGRPFVGGAGRLLDNMLSNVGINRKECYIDNVVRIRPPHNKFSALPSSVVEEGKKRLKLSLKVVSPNVIVAFGNNALEALTNKTGITKWRGSILQGCTGKVVPTFHPAWVLRQWSGKPLVEFDLSRAKEESKSPEINLPQPTFTLNPSMEMAMKLLREAEDAEYLAFDIETLRGSCGLPICISFSTAPHTAFCIPFLVSGVPRWSRAEELELWAAITRLFSSPKPKKIAQNVMFDAYVLHSILDIDIVNFWMDTMLLHHVIYAELPKGLDTLCSIYTRYPYYKDIPSKGGGDEEFWRYNCLDSCVTLECALKLRQEAEEFGVWDYYVERVNPLIWPLLQMQSKGIKVDAKMREKVAEETSARIAEYEDTLTSILGHELNVNSPKQMKEVLYKELGLPPRRKDGAITTNEAAIRKLKKKFPDNPVLDLVLKIRKERKLLSTYLTTPYDEDGYMRCSYNIAGTKGTRISSSKTVFGTGGNLQNIPAGTVRRFLVADEGKIFVAGDLSQADARCVAYLAQEETMIEIFSDPSVDFYEEVAKMVFGTGAERQTIKKVVHASNYCMGAETLSSILEVSMNEAKEIMAKYAQTFPRIGVWHLQVEQQLRKTRILEFPFGRKRIFFGRFNGVMFRDAIAAVPQSTVAEVLHQAIVSIHGCMPEYMDLILHVHDSLTVQCPEDKEEEAREMVKRAYDVPITIHRRTFTIPVKIKSGRNWDEIS